jgi:sortase A
MRRALRLLALVMIVAGGLLLADGVATLAWREPVTSVYAGAQQARLDSRLRTAERRVRRADSARGLRRAAGAMHRPDSARGLRRAARAARRRAAPGEPLGRVRAPAIGLRAVVGEGTEPADLRRGPGHYARTALPGLRGTVALAGHRTTYGAQFRRLDDLRRGDRVELAMPYGRFAYRVERTRVVAPTATWVTRRVSYDRLVLTACHPLFSAAERIVVFARLVAARPV